MTTLHFLANVVIIGPHRLHTNWKVHETLLDKKTESFSGNVTTST